MVGFDTDVVPEEVDVCDVVFESSLLQNRTRNVATGLDGDIEGMQKGNGGLTPHSQPK